MIYDLRNPLEVQKARLRFETLINRAAVVELKEKLPKRSVSQNSYLHLILGYFASQTGNTLEWVKQRYYKHKCNSDLFLRHKEDAFLGKVSFLRSSSELTKDEMTLSIERFRNWAASEGEIYIPEPTNIAEVTAMTIEVEKYKEYI